MTLDERKKRKRLLSISLLLPLIVLGSAVGLLWHKHHEPWAPPQADFITGILTTPWGDTVDFKVQDDGTFVIECDGDEFFTGLHMTVQPKHVTVSLNQYYSTGDQFVIGQANEESRSVRSFALNQDRIVFEGIPQDSFSFTSLGNEFHVHFTGVKRQTKAFETTPIFFNAGGNGTGCIGCQQAIYCGQNIDAPCGSSTVEMMWISPEDARKWKLGSLTDKGPDGGPDRPR